MKLKTTAIAVAAILGSPMVLAATMAVESEPNDSLATANQVTAADAVTYFSGALTPEFSGSASPVSLSEATFSTSGSLEGNDVDSYLFDATLAGLSAGDDFVAITDNSQSGVDTVLGVFDANGMLVDTDDDSSFVGDGLADGIYGQVNSDGKISLKVSGYPDFDFDGNGDGFEGGGDSSHGENGDYDLYVFTGAAANDAIEFIGYGGEGGGEYFDVDGDLDYVTIDGLAAGQVFVAQLFGDIDFAYPGGGGGINLTGATLPESHAGLLGLFDDNGNLIAADNAQNDPTIRIGGIVPASGQLNFGITGWFDPNFDGTQGYEGNYELRLETFALGDPGGPPIDDVIELPDDNPGAQPGDPFIFSDLIVEDGHIINLDPIVAIGYEYEIIAGTANFATVSLPSVGTDTMFTITYNDGMGDVSVDVSAGVVFDFTSVVMGGVNAFTVTGIDVNQAPLASDGMGFVTTVTTIGSGGLPFTVSQDPIAFDTDAGNNNGNVPAPGILALLGAGLLAASGMRRRRRSH